MMQDRNISLGCLASYGLWALSILMLGFSVVASSLGPRTFITLQTGAIVCTGAAGVATVRSYFVAQNRMMRNAFELGRESAAADKPTPTPIRPR